MSGRNAVAAASGDVSGERIVVVIGGGAAGLSAAVTAAEEGPRVVLVEVAGELGGSSARAMGSLTGSQTRRQADAGIDDSHEAHLEDLVRAQGDDAVPEMMGHLEAVASDCGPAVDWLAGLGVAFSGPHPEPPHRVPRMHNVVPTSRALPEALARLAREQGVAFRLGARARRLIADGSRVAGVVIVQEDGDEEMLRADAVVLASGDASAALHERSDELPGPVNEAARGDGVQMARQLGARAYDPWPSVQVRAASPPHYHPSAALLAAGAIPVDSAGRRIAGRPEDLLKALAELDDDTCAYLLDAHVAARVARGQDDGATGRDGWLRTGRAFISTFPGIGYAYLEDLLAAGLAVEGDTPGAVASALGLDVGALDQHSGHGGVLDRPPYYGIGPFRRFVVYSDGALETDRELRVVREDGAAIPGLWAAGSTAWGPFRTHGHGIHLGWAVVSGRRAGRSAASAIEASADAAANA